MKNIYDGSMDKRSFKDAFGELIPAMCERDPDVIYLDGDLMSCIGTAKWAASHPERAINCGIAEANMIGVAAGLAAAGFKPVCHTFGPFASRRVYDQAFLSAGYGRNPITIIGSDPGVTAAFNGGTHMPFEDTALYRAMPEATVMEMTDTAMLMSVLPKAVELPGVKYIRVHRKNNARVYPDGCDIEIGRANVLRDGSDLVIFASGIMVHEAMQAAAALEGEGVSAAVIDVFTIKPIDRETIAKYAAKTGRVVVAENHDRIGGLTSAVSEVLAAECPAPLEYAAVEDVFGSVGPLPYLQEFYGLTAARIVEKAKAVLARPRA